MRAQLPLFMSVTCLALLLVLPFVLPFNTLPVTTFYQEWVAFALGSIVFVAGLWWQRGEAIVIPRTVILPAGLCVLLLAQALMGRLGYWQVGTLGVIYLVWSIVMLCAGATLYRHLGADLFCVTCAWAFCIGALISAATGLVQLAGWQPGGLVMSMIGPRVHANLAQPNHFAAYLCLGLFSLCYLYAANRINVYFAAVLVALMLLAADVSGSRSVWAYLVAGLLLAGWTHYRARTRQTRLLGYSVLAVFVGMVVVSMLTTALNDQGVVSADVMRGAHSQGARMLSDVAGVSHRRSIWSAAWRIFESAPVAGAGFGGFAWAYFRLAGRLPAGQPEEIVDHAHNVALQMLAEFGLPGAILLIGAAIAWGVVAMRTRAGLHSWWALALVAVIGLYSMVGYPLWYAYFLGVFAMLVGALDRPVWQLAPSRLSRIAIIGAGAIMAWALISVLVDYRLAERLGIESAATRDNRGLIVEAARASHASLFGHLIELGIVRTIALDQTAIDAKAELNARVLRVFPAPDVAYRQSALYALQGDIGAALPAWDLAARAYPGHAGAMAEMLAARLAAGEVMLAPLVEYAASRNRGTQ
jgi:O-antigen ligase